MHRWDSSGLSLRVSCWILFVLVPHVADCEHHTFVGERVGRKRDKTFVSVNLAKIGCIFHVKFDVMVREKIQMYESDAFWSTMPKKQDYKIKVWEALKSFVARQF